MAQGAGAHIVSKPSTVDNLPRRLSTIFEEMARGATGPVTVEALREALGDRSFAALMVFFAGLNMLPLPPGSTVVLGIPLLLLAIQMVLGRRTVWLPRLVLEKSVSAESFRQMSGKLIPRIRWLERLIRPRYWPFARDHADRVIGVVALVLAVAVILPVPLGNWLPAFACALVGIALSERDGVLLAIAVAVGVLSLLIIATVIGAAGFLATLLIARAA